MKEKRRLLTYFSGFWLFLLLFKFGGGLHYVLMSPLGEKVLPLWIVGLLMSLASIIQLILDIPAGKILDRFGYKRMLALGTIIFIISSLFLLKFNQLFFIFSVLLSSLGWLFFGPGENAYSLSHAKKQESNKFMAFKDMFGAIGVVLSSILVPFIIIFSPKIISLTISALLLLAFIALIFSPRDQRKISLFGNVHENTHHQRRNLFLNMSKVLKKLNPPSTLLVLLNFVSGLFYGVIWFVIPLVIAHSTQNTKLLGIGLGMFDFAIIIAGLIFISLADKINKKVLILIGLTLFSISSIILGFNLGLLFLVFAFLSTMGNEFANLPLWSWLHQLDKKHNHDGLISGMINLSSDLGWAIGPLLAGLLYTLIGATKTIIIGAIPILIVSLIYYFVIKKHIIHFSIFEKP